MGQSSVQPLTYHPTFALHVKGTLACVCRYKQQLSLAVERGQSLEREQVQLGLDWQRRCDDVERDQIQRSETLIQGLTKARDQVCWVLWVWSISSTVQDGFGPCHIIF